MDNYQLLSDDEVLYVRSGRVLVANPTFRVSEFLDALAQLISDNEEEWTDESEGWFSDRGQLCEVLRVSNQGQGWQRGRVRIRLEFQPADRPKLLPESTPRSENISREEPYSRRRDENYAREPYNNPYPPSKRTDRYPDLDLNFDDENY